jgi:hypothetical protein
MKTAKYGKMEVVLVEWFGQNALCISACAYKSMLS